MKLLLGLAVLISAPVFATPQVSEVAIEEAFVAPKGYDTNDNVEIIIDGKLPNACFEIYKSNVDVDQKKFEITLQQLVKVKNITECQANHQDHQNIPMWPIQYTNRLELGNLKAGTYKVNYNTGTTVTTKTFEVSATVSSGIDDFLYAPISNAFIPELIYSTDSAEVILTGILTNTCMNFNGEVEVQRMGNVFIVLPKMSLNTFTQCSPTQIPLQSIVSLGAIKKEGRYLVHVRSTTGRSVNKVFTVKSSPFDNVGRHHTRREK